MFIARKKPYRRNNRIVYASKYVDWRGNICLSKKDFPHNCEFQDAFEDERFPRYLLLYLSSSFIIITFFIIFIIIINQKLARGQGVIKNEKL